MFVYSDFDGATAALSMVKLRDGIRHRAADIVGKVEVEIVDSDIDGCITVSLNTLGKVGGNGDDGRCIDVVIQHFGLLWSCVGDTEHVGVVEDLHHLYAFRAMIQVDKGDRAAPNGCGSQRSN